MKTLFYFVWMTVAVLLLGARCDRENKPDIPPQTPPVEEPQEPDPVKKTPDDFDGPSMGYRKAVIDNYLMIFRIVEEEKTVYIPLFSNSVTTVTIRYFICYVQGWSPVWYILIICYPEKKIYI